MYVIGLDVGTTGVKAIVTNENGAICGKGYKEYNLIIKGEKIAEQSAGDWYDGAAFAILQACKGLDKNKITAMALSTQGSTMLAVDKDFSPLCNAITWMDKRAGAESAYLIKQIGAERVYEKTGWKLGATNDAAKILWLKNHMPELFKKSKNFVSTLEYMNYMLTGFNVTDPTNSAIRCLTDFKNDKYDSEILNAIGIDTKCLPDILPTGSTVGKLTKSAADKFGLSANVTVYNGAHDQYCASLGSGAVSVGDMLIATGTTWVALGITDKPTYTKSKIAPGKHPIKNRFGAMASFVRAGSALKWYSNIIGASYKEIDKNAADRKNHAQKLFFAPFVFGSGFLYSQSLDAAIRGFNVNNNKYDIALALMEGVAFETKAILAEFLRHGAKVSNLFMAGRAAKSDLWRGLVRDVTGCNVTLAQTEDTSCMGAAMIAAVGCGMHTNLNSAATAMVSLLNKETPDVENKMFYEEKYGRYLQFINTLY